MRITAKGQVTIPANIRRQLGLLPNTEVGFRVDGDSVWIGRTRSRPAKSQVRAAIKRLSGSAKGGMTTDEVLKLMRGE